MNKKKQLKINKFENQINKHVNYSYLDGVKYHIYKFFLSCPFNFKNLWTVDRGTDKKKTVKSPYYLFECLILIFVFVVYLLKYLNFKDLKLRNRY